MWSFTVLWCLAAKAPQSGHSLACLVELDNIGYSVFSGIRVKDKGNGWLAVLAWCVACESMSSRGNVARHGLTGGQVFLESLLPSSQVLLSAVEVLNDLRVGFLP